MDDFPSDAMERPSRTASTMWAPMMASSASASTTTPRCSRSPPSRHGGSRWAASARCAGSAARSPRSPAGPRPRRSPAHPALGRRRPRRRRRDRRPARRHSARKRMPSYCIPSLVISGCSASGTISNARKSARSRRAAACSRPRTFSADPVSRRSMSRVVRARSRRSSRTSPPFNVAVSPSTATTLARKRSNTRSWRRRAKSGPLPAAERTRCSRACLKASGEAYVRAVTRGAPQRPSGTL